MTKYMIPRNRPNSNTDSGLTPIGRGPAGEWPGSAPESNAAGSPRASRPALRGLFAPGTPAAAEATPGGSGCLPADVDALVALPGHPGRAAGVDVAAVAAAEPVAGLGMEASIRSGTGAAVTVSEVDPDVLATAAAGDVGQRVEVLASAERGETFAPAPGDLVVAGG